MDNRHNRERGVTLMELLTVIMVIGILAAVAIPSYRRYLMRAQRSDATTALLRVAASQEKHMLQYGVYVTATGSMMNAHSAGGLGLSATSDQGFYALSLASTATGYTVTATPISGKGQSDDTNCATFVVDENGTKKAYSSASVDKSAECFR